MTIASTPDRVAVVIPVFRARFLAEALESVFSQTRPADEVIVVDDGSPDRAELEAAQNRWGDRLRLLTQPNSGAGAARNHGVRSTDAGLIAFLDADDRWVDDSLATQLSQLAAHPDCDIVYSNALYFGETPLAGRRFMDLCPSRGEVNVTSLLALRCHIPLSAVVARRQVLIDTGLFDPSLRRGQDFDLWMRLAVRGVRFTHHAMVLMHHRIHEDNLSGPRITRMERAATVFRKALASLPLTPEQRALASTQICRFEDEIAIERGKELLTRGEFAGAMDALSAARRTAARWKVDAALLGLRIAPQLVRRLYMSRVIA